MWWEAGEGGSGCENLYGPMVFKPKVQPEQALVFNKNPYQVACTSSLMS